MKMRFLFVLFDMSSRTPNKTNFSRSLLFSRRDVKISITFKKPEAIHKARWITTINYETKLYFLGGLC